MKIMCLLILIGASCSCSSLIRSPSSESRIIIADCVATDVYNDSYFGDGLTKDVFPFVEIRYMDKEYVILLGLHTFGGERKGSIAKTEIYVKPTAFGVSYHVNPYLKLERYRIQIDLTKSGKNAFIYAKNRDRLKDKFSSWETIARMKCKRGNEDD